MSASWPSSVAVPRGIFAWYRELLPRLSFFCAVFQSRQVFGGTVEKEGSDGRCPRFSIFFFSGYTSMCERDVSSYLSRVCSRRPGGSWLLCMCVRLLLLPDARLWRAMGVCRGTAFMRLFVYFVFVYPVSVRPYRHPTRLSSTIPTCSPAPPLPMFKLGGRPAGTRDRHRTDTQDTMSIRPSRAGRLGTIYLAY